MACVNLKTVTLDIDQTDCGDYDFSLQCLPTIELFTVNQTPMFRKSQAAAFHTKVAQFVTHVNMGHVCQLLTTFHLDQIHCPKLQELKFCRAFLPSLKFVRYCPVLRTLQLLDVVVGSEEDMDIFATSSIRVALSFTYSPTPLNECKRLFEKFVPHDRLTLAIVS